MYFKIKDKPKISKK